MKTSRRTFLKTGVAAIALRTMLWLDRSVGRS